MSTTPAEADTAPRKKRRKPSPLVKGILVAVGIVATGLGAVGVILPVLPTTPFLIVAAAAFLRSSDRLYDRLMASPKFGPALRRIKDGKGIALKVKIISMSVATAAIGSFAVFGTDRLWLRFLLGGVLLAKAVVMVAIPTYVAADTKAKPFRIRAPRGPFFVSLAIGISMALANMILAVGIGRWVYASTQTGIELPPLSLAAVLAIRFALTIASGFVGGRLSEGARRAARDALFQSVETGGPDMVRTEGVGSLHTLLNERVESLDPYFALYLPQLFVGLLAPLTVIAYLISVDPFTGLILFAAIPIAPLLLGLVQKRFRVVGKEYSVASQELSALYLDSLRSIQALKIFSRVSSYASLLRKRSATLRKRTIRLLATNQLALLLVELFFSLTIVAAGTILGIQRFQIGALRGAVAFAMPFVAIELTRPVNLVGAFFFAGAIGRDAKRSIEQFVRGARTSGPAEDSSMEASSIVGKHSHVQTEESGSGEAGIVLHDVCFAYPGAPERRVLESVSLSVAPGEIVGLAGSSGSGKSTVAKLVLGLYQVTEGVLSIDGASVSELSREAIAEKVGYLPQRPYLFSGTLRENIALGRPSASDSDILKAVESAGLAAFASRLPGGLEHTIGEDGGTVSGGERTRVALARALLVGSRYLILDEPTAAMDAELESDIWDQLRGLEQKPGILVIAHRRTTLASCDRVVQLNHPRLEEEAGAASTRAGAVHA